jgi:hypothetical protein
MRVCKRKGGGRGLLQIEAKSKPEIINIAVCLNIKYKEDKFLNIFKRHGINQPNTNSKIKTQ